jgi:hypothetical protein
VLLSSSWKVLLSRSFSPLLVKKALLFSTIYIP